MLGIDGRLIGILLWSVVLAARDHPDEQVDDVMIAPMAVAYPTDLALSG